MSATSDKHAAERVGKSVRDINDVGRARSWRGDSHCIAAAVSSQGCLLRTIVFGSSCHRRAASLLRLSTLSAFTCIMKALGSIKVVAGHITFKRVLHCKTSTVQPC